MNSCQNFSAVRLSELTFPVVRGLQNFTFQLLELSDVDFPAVIDIRIYLPPYQNFSSPPLKATSLRCLRSTYVSHFDAIFVQLVTSSSPDGITLTIHMIGFLCLVFFFLFRFFVCLVGFLVGGILVVFFFPYFVCLFCTLTAQKTTWFLILRSAQFFLFCFTFICWMDKVYWRQTKTIRWFSAWNLCLPPILQTRPVHAQAIHSHHELFKCLHSYLLIYRHVKQNVYGIQHAYASRHLPKFILICWQVSKKELLQIWHSDFPRDLRWRPRSITLLSKFELKGPYHHNKFKSKQFP